MSAVVPIDWGGRRCVLERLIHPSPPSCCLQTAADLLKDCFEIQVMKLHGLAVLASLCCRMQQVKAHTHKNAVVAMHFATGCLTVPAPFRGDTEINELVSASSECYISPSLGLSGTAIIPLAPAQSPSVGRGKSWQHLQQSLEGSIMAEAKSTQTLSPSVHLYQIAIRMLSDLPVCASLVVCVHTCKAAIHIPSGLPVGAGHSPGNAFMAPLVSNERITSADHFQDVRHLVFSTAGSSLEWQPGDALAIMPRQSAAAVHALLHRLGIPVSAQVLVEATGSSALSLKHMSFTVGLFFLPRSNHTRSFSPSLLDRGKEIKVSGWWHGLSRVMHCICW